MASLLSMPASMALWRTILALLVGSIKPSQCIRCVSFRRSVESSFALVYSANAVLSCCLRICFLKTSGVNHAKFSIFNSAKSVIAVSAWQRVMINCTYSLRSDLDSRFNKVSRVNFLIGISATTSLAIRANSNPHRSCC